MKVHSTKRPQPFKINISGDEVIIKFAENITTLQSDNKSQNRGRFAAEEVAEEDTTIMFEYDCYTLVTKRREGLEDDISAHLEQWLNKAKKTEIDKLSADIRAKRDMLLAETDKEFALDRVNLTIPEKVTASTMLNVIKDIFSELGAVCNGEMARYRQALRDLPQQEGFPYDVKFPVKPNN